MSEKSLDVTPFMITSALPFSLPTLSGAFARSFEGYVMPIPDDPVAFAQRVRSEQIDLSSSLVALCGDEIIGLTLIARRVDTARVAAMGVVPAWRGRGVGEALMRAALDAARARGERRGMLEVIDGNDRACRLYRGLGFEVRRRLVGYERPAGGGQPGEIHQERVEIIAAEVAKLTDVPWQLDVPSVLASGPLAKAVRVGPAVALLSVMAERVILRALVVPENQRGQGHATRLLQTLVAEYADRSWVVPPIMPESWGHSLFIRNGFNEQSLRQLEMTVAL